MISTYLEAQEYLEQFIQPQIYEKITVGSGDQHDPLGRMHLFLQFLNNPQNTFPSVVVSGTSGKGSTTYLIANMLAAAGYRTGMATSPHLQKMNERIVISNAGQLMPIQNHAFVKLVREVLPTIERLGKTEFGFPTYYEILAAITCLFFAQKKIDIGVIEVGLEGKFDATNVINPILFVLTNISLDHTAILGNTVMKIADEATHRILSIKSQHEDWRPAIITGATQKSVLSLIQKRAKTPDASVMILNKDFFATDIREQSANTSFTFRDKKINYPHLVVSLLGRYQAENASLAIKTILSLGQFGFVVSQKQIRKALASAFFPGRFEVTKNIIFDGAHNEAKMKAFLGSLHTLYPHQKKVFLIAFKKDKDIDTLLALIAKHADALVVTKFTTSIDMGKNLGMPVEYIKQHIKKKHSFPSKNVIVENSASEALSKGRFLAKQMNALLVITGSLYLVGEIKDLLETP